MSPDERSIIQVDRLQRKKTRFGGFNTIDAACLVNRELREKLERSDLPGLEHISTIPEPGKTLKKPLWQISSNITLPPCLTPTYDRLKEEKEPGAERGRNDAIYWNDEGISPPVLKFRRSEIEATPPFDIAKTKELTGGGVNTLAPSLIVTQRFRKTLAALIPPREQPLYAPVKLV
jgi:hypothetical protein